MARVFGAPRGRRVEMRLNLHYNTTEDPVSTGQNTPALSQTCDDNRNQPVTEFGDSIVCCIRDILEAFAFISSEISSQQDETLSQAFFIIT